MIFFFEKKEWKHCLRKLERKVKLHFNASVYRVIFFAVLKLLMSRYQIGKTLSFEKYKP